MSIRAFETDVNVGGKEGECPPEFDSIEWHKQMAREGHLYQAMIEKNFPWAAEFYLDTPCWNERTNAFYKRLGYRIIKVEDGFNFYQKSISRPYAIQNFT